MARVHVVPGDSAAGGLRLALGNSVEDVVVGLGDALSCGPLRRASTLEEWVTARRQFWNEVLQGDGDNVAPLPDRAVLEQATTVTLWLGNGLGDQLTLPWFVWLLEMLGIPFDRLHVAQFPRDFVPQHRTPSLGMLSPDMIRKHPSARPIEPPETEALGRLWLALTDADPSNLCEMVPRVETTSLRHALPCLAWRYPNADTGIAFWDRALLVNVKAHGPRTPYVLGHTLAGPGWDVDPVGDGWLFWRLRRMAATSQGLPLIELSGDPRSYRTCDVAITDAGARLLEGLASAVSFRHIDEWGGGTHLRSRDGGVWVAKNAANPDEAVLPNSGLQLTWRSLALAPRS